MRRLSTVHEEDVEESVVIEIKKTDTSTHGFNEESIRRFPAELLPSYASLFSDVRKDFIGS